LRAFAYRKIPEAGSLFIILAIAVLTGGPAAAADPVDPLKLTRAAIEDGLYELAERRASEFLASAPQSSPGYAEALDLFFQALNRQGKFEAILSASRQQRIPDDKPAIAALLCYWRAAALSGLGKKAEALAELTGFEARHPSSDYRPSSRLLRASILLDCGKTDDALEEMAAFDRDYPSSPWAADNRLKRAEVLESLGRHEEAIAVLEGVQSPPFQPEAAARAACLSARNLFRLGRSEAAVATASQVASNAAVQGDLRAEAYYLLGEIREAQTNLDACLAAFSNGMECASSPGMKRRGAYLTALRLLDGPASESSLQWARNFVAQAPNTEEAQQIELRLASCLLRNGMAAEAEKEYLRYQESYTNAAGLAMAFEGRGWALLSLNRAAEAASDFLKSASLAANPGDKARCLYKAADSSYTNAQYATAASLYDRVVAEHPGSPLAPNAALQAADCTFRTGDADAALLRYEKIIATFAGTDAATEAMLRIGEIQRSQGRHKEALATFERVLQTASNSVAVPRALHNKGMTLHHLFRFSEAKETFEKMVADYPGHPLAEQAFYMRGICDFALGRDDQALSEFAAFLDTFPDSPRAPEILFWMGKYHYNAGNFPEAERILLKLVERNPSGDLADSALLLAGLAASKSKEFVRALSCFNKLVKEYPQSPRIPEARFAQAEAMTELADLTGAILVLDEIILKHPESDLVPAAWGRKGDCQFTLGEKNHKRYEEAIESYRVVRGIAGARSDLALQAEYKIGRCLEKLGRTDQALQQYYEKVMIPYLDELEKGRWHNESSKTWFTRAAFSAADILESRRDWEGAVRMLRRVTEADVPAARDAEDRIRRIKSENWWNFLNSGG